MKKLAITLSALAAFTGSAFAADMAPAPPAYSKAPVVVAAPSWTGFYIFGGAGGGLWAADSNPTLFPSGVATTALSQRYGGSGYFGTVGAGYDWQFSGSWVAGVFADGTFGSIKGTITDPIPGVAGISGNEKLQDMWAAGVRVGYLVAPNVYSYVNAGYNGSQWSGTTLAFNFSGVADRTTASFNRQGWFVGSGVENSLNIFGIAAHGWFMKTEYRASVFNSINIPQLTLAGAPTPFGIAFKPWTQTVSTSLVYRFNWAGPVVARY
jgi:outer membrane immunogenic protein